MEYKTRTELNGQVLVIEIPEYLDYSISDDLRSQLKTLVEQGHFKFVFDLTSNKYIDSSGLGALVSRISSIRSNGGDLRLASPCEAVVSVLNLTHLNKIIKCFDDLSVAVESFK